MQKVILASGNRGKIAELKSLLTTVNLDLHSQAEFNITSVEETGLTFIENALIKARHAAKKTHLPALADDSGLCVDALNAAPGIYSARYAGENANDQDRIEKLLHEMNQTDISERSASFYCALVFLQSADDPAPLIGYGRWPGRILTAPQGNQGFGYDPIFYVPEHNCSAAELEPHIKNKISHRGRAMQMLLEALQQ
ncbi:MAG: RdgB/HAM1 family non-canonical purine NTP pyrophosphatase [Gammaproteobacteria bacterium]|nr:RdgB/HAM1 family non-canonical purine NTP pyrophosphatase [Gammaproteobacteria bacterium]